MPLMPLKEITCGALSETARELNLLWQRKGKIGESSSAKFFSL
jgi:hypothetical protein